MHSLGCQKVTRSGCDSVLNRPNDNVSVATVDILNHDLLFCKPLLNIRHSGFDDSRIDLIR